MLLLRDSKSRSFPVCVDGLVKEVCSVLGRHPSWQTDRDEVAPRNSGLFYGQGVLLCGSPCQGPRELHSRDLCLLRTIGFLPVFVLRRIVSEGMFQDSSNWYYHTPADCTNSHGEL